LHYSCGGGGGGGFLLNIFKGLSPRQFNSLFATMLTSKKAPIKI